MIKVRRYYKSNGQIKHRYLILNKTFAGFNEWYGGVLQVNSKKDYHLL